MSDRDLLSELTDLEEKIEPYDGRVTDEKGNVVQEGQSEVEDQVVNNPQDTTTDLVSAEEMEQLQGMSATELQALKNELEGVVEETVVEEEIPTPKPNPGKGNLKTALSIAREKTQAAKQEKSLVEKENDLMKRQLDVLQNQMTMLQTSNVSQNAPQGDDQTNELEKLLSELDENESITKNELERLFQARDNIQQQKFKTDRASQLAIDFNNSHGKELGELSYENVYSQYMNGTVKLTQGQQFDIENAINVGKNPAEVLYETVISQSPNLQGKRGVTNNSDNNDLSSLINRLITEKSGDIDNDSLKSNKQRTKQDIISEDFKDSESGKMKEHFKNLSKF